MDPNATLDELLALTRSLLNTPDADGVAESRLDPADAIRAAELVEALDGWLMMGGYLPRRWQPADRPPRPSTRTAAG